MPKLGATELIIILVIVLLIFGVGKLPQIGGAIGKSMREFRKAKEEVAEERVAVEATISDTKK